MTNTSATGGFLTPDANPYIPATQNGPALVAFIQTQLVGLTGLPGNLVRQRWQPNPPNLPANTVDWAAFAVVEGKGETNATEYHITPDPTVDPLYPDPFDVIERNEEFSVPVSVYGPNADTNARLIRENYSVAQNREPLFLNGIGYVGAGTVTPMPSLVNEIWYYRVDITLSFRRVVRQVYPVLNIASADGTLNTDIPPTTREIIVTNT